MGKLDFEAMRAEAEQHEKAGIGGFGYIARAEVNALTLVATQILQQGAPPEAQIQLPLFALTRLLSAHLAMRRRLESIVAREEAGGGALSAKDMASSLLADLDAADPKPPEPKRVVPGSGIVLPPGAKL